MKNAQGILYLIPSVIAENTEKEVLPPQLLEICKHTNYFLVENIRTARRFISSLGLGIAISELQFEVLDKKTPDNQVSGLLQPLLKGENVGILSEAGCPGVADPGARAVSWAHKNGVRVVPLVGPSSLLLALMGSGFSGQSFAFTGYLPVKGPEKVQAIRRLEKQALAGQTQLFMETPYRNNQLLADLLEHLQPNTKLCVASGLTGSQEFVRTLPVAAWKKNKPDIHKIPTIFLLGTT